MCVALVASAGADPNIPDSLHDQSDHHAGEFATSDDQSNVEVADDFFVPQGEVLWRTGLILGACNLVGGYLGARTAVAKGAPFVRVFFIVVVSGFIVRIGGDVVGVW